MAGIPLINASTTGTMYGQFHGNEATGVSGGFHSMDNFILGAFAGSNTTAPTPITILATPSANLTTFNVGTGPNPQMGGVGRVGRTDVDGIAGDGMYQVDGKDAIIIIATDNDYANLMADPSGTHLLSNTTSLDYSGARPMAGGAFSATANITTGVLYETTDTLLYIDNNSAVALAYQGTARNFVDHLQFVTVGEPLSNLPTGNAALTYSGLAAMGIDADGFNIAEHAIFNMGVNFGTEMVTSFSADFGGDGSIAASNLPIDTSLGSFTGALTFTPPTMNPAAAMITTDTTGTMYGQFHGDGATGVTGGFHSMNNALLGAFAGSKE